MQEIKIRKMKFGSFIKLTTLISGSVGIVFGLFLFVASIFGGNVNANLGETQLTGVAGGIASIFIGPIVFMIFGAIFGLVGFLPFKYILRIFKGLNLKFDFEENYSENEKTPFGTCD